MTAANLETNNSSKIESLNENLKPKLLPNKKVYYSDRYIYLDKSEFQIVWHNVALFIFLHTMWFLGLYGILTFDSEFVKCVPISFIYAIISGFGVTCGAHRLWSHRSYKARLPLRLFLIAGHTIAGQNNLVVWCRDHRVHHKFSDTDADPHNTNRGFFFAHMGWLMFKKHPDVLVKGNKIDLSDLKNDPLIQFQEKYYYLLFVVINLIIPIYTSMYVFGATFYKSFLYAFMLRYATTLHSTWFVNSAHMFGDQPYNERIRPVENIFVSFFSIGEGYHNYHHTFPFDYATSEFSRFNLAKRFIDFMARRGLAYDLKKASKTIVENSRMNVEKRLYKVNREDANNNDYTLINETERQPNGLDGKHSNGLNGKHSNGALNKVNGSINDEELKEKIEKIKNKKPNGLHRVNTDKNDLNNNIFNKILNESNEIKGR